MSVRKIIKVENVGKFKCLLTRGSVEFSKLTLIYGANGYGKSTIAAILRSLARSDSNYILERATAGVEGEPLIEVLTGAGVARFSNGSWSGTEDSIEAFDETFVTENVYTGNCVEQSHRRNLYEVVVGEEAVRVQRQVDAIDTESRNAAKELSRLEDEIAKVCGREYALADFLALPRVDNPDALVNSLRSQIKRAHQAELLRQRPEPQHLALPSSPTEIFGIVSATVAVRAAEVVEQVQAHISSHMRGGDAEGWLRKGLDHQRDASCPFCGQETVTSELLNLYQGYFSRAYRDSVEAIKSTLKSVTTSYRDDAIESIVSRLIQNGDLMQQWGSEITTELPTLAVDTLRSACLDVRASAVEVLERKLQNPVDSIGDTARLDTALERWAEIEQSANHYNLMVRKVVSEIREVKRLAGQPRIPDLESDIRRVEASVSRHSDDVLSLEKALSGARARKAELEARKKKSKDALTNLVSKLLRDHEGTINKYLARFGATFRIVKTAPSFRGGKASSDYKIEINNVPIPLGDKTTPPGTACFRTTLSAGDRSTLALAFFLSRLERDPRISERVVVLDDPFSSMDRFRLACTQHEISSLCGRTKQVLVLSHDPFFLKRLVDRTVSADVKALQLRHERDRSVLLEWDIDADTRSADQQDFFVLHRFAEGDHTPGSDVKWIAGTIRRFLEGHLRTTFPNQWGPREWLGNMIASIREADDSSALAGYRERLDELTQLNDYSAPMHHGEPFVGASSTEPEEVRRYVQRALALTQRHPEAP